MHFKQTDLAPQFEMWIFIQVVICMLLLSFWLIAQVYGM